MASRILFGDPSSNVFVKWHSSTHRNGTTRPQRPRTGQLCLPAATQVFEISGVSCLQQHRKDPLKMENLTACILLLQSSQIASRLANLKPSGRRESCVF